MQNSDENGGGTRLIVLLIGMTMLAPFAIDAYLPAFPLMSAEFQVAQSGIQLTLAAFLLGMSLGPLLAGPISDALGRRRVILAGLAGFLAFSLACAWAQNVDQLVVIRFFQALAGSSTLVASRALLADIYRGDRLAQKNALISMFLALAPMLAPMIGGWLTALAGWRAIFWLLASATTVCFLFSARFLPETLPPARRFPLDPGGMLRGYRLVLKNRLALTYALASAGIMAVFFTYVAVTPFLYIELYGMSVSAYSMMFGAGAMLAIVGNYLNIWAVGRFGFRLVLLVLGMAVMGFGVMLFSAGFGLLGRWAIYLPGLMFMPLLHMVGANAITGAMEQFDSGKGAASALFLSLRFGAGILAVSIVGSLGDVSEMRYGLIVFVFAALSGVAAQMAVRWDETE